jgi:malate permease and related proteins
MDELTIVRAVVPIASLFFVGMLLRRSGVLAARHGAWLLRIVVLVGLPAMFLGTVSRLPLHAALGRLPGIAIVTALATGLAAALVGRRLALPRAAFGGLLVCAMTMNLAFEMPFVLAAWGERAFSELALFDMGNALTLSTVVYYIAARFGGHAQNARGALLRLLAFPPLWAMILALTLNLLQLPPPAPLTTLLTQVGRTLMLLIVVALGLLFDGRRLGTAPVLWTVAARCLFGLAIGWLAASIFGLEHELRRVVLLGAAAPIGFASVVAAHRESLDEELVVAAASLSALLGVFYVPIALILLH